MWNMSVLSYACAIETAPGVTVPMTECTPLDLARARALEARRERVRQQLARLVAAAIRYNLALPDDTREAVAMWDGDVLTGEQLLEQLRDALLQAA